VPLLDRVAVFDRMAILGTPTLGVLIVYGLVFFHFWRAPRAAPILPAHEATPTRSSAA